MAKKGRKRRPRGKRTERRKIFPALLISFLLVSGLFGWMYANAAIVRVCPAEVYLPDLPAPFDGTTLLYISDVNIRNQTDATASSRLLESLSALSPDIVMLGGDYSARTLLDALNGATGDGATAAREFVATLAGFPAPLGKFAVLGEADDDSLRDIFAMASVQLLQDEGTILEQAGARVAVVGLRDVSEDATPYDQIGRSFSSGDCVLVLAHNPLAYPRIRMAEADGGGPWADLVLSGHTLGGQIKLFGRPLRPFNEEEARRVAGWYYGDDRPILVSQGLGCRGAKLRLGTQSEVWYLTLRRPEWKAIES